MRLLAYVSDEMFVALPDVAGEFAARDSGEVTLLRSSPSGGFYGELGPGHYRVTLSRSGFSPKISLIHLGTEPFHFRMLPTRVAGYMWPKWARSGEPCEYRVHASEQYQLSLWRYGWKRELVSIVTWVDEHGPGANQQTLPDGDFTQTGVGWNERGFPSPPTIAAPRQSGLYYLWAKTPSGDSFSFPWVVAPAQPAASIAVLASTNTWNAYNNYGGRSNYIHAAQLPARPVVNARQELDRYSNQSPFATWAHPDDAFSPLSFDRPEPHNHLFDNPEVTGPLQGRVQCGLAPAEWRLLGWLEREGFAYDLYAEAQLHEGLLDLNAYQVLVLSVHPEYWTRKMYLTVKDWVFNRGGKLMYLGGNGLNCEVELPGDGTMRCLSHLNSLAGELGGHSEDGAVEYESRLHRTLESEANLLGVVCTVSGIMTAAPYRVIREDHWIFTGTHLSNGDLFGEQTQHERIPGGASGHETDKRSASSPANTVLLAKGINPDDGGAEIVLHQPPGGGAVFSVGSITWVPALLPDPHVSRITSNVLTRFLSGTLNNGLT